MLEILATIFSITGAVLIVLKQPIGYAFWIVSNILWTAFSAKKKHWWQMATWIIFCGLSIWGLIAWSI
jgi:nicotinamide riboside transporter PnuC